MSNNRNTKQNAAEIQNGKLQPKSNRGNGAPAPKPSPKKVDKLVKVMNACAWVVTTMILLDGLLGGAAIYDGFDDPAEAVERAHFMWAWGFAHLTALGCVQGLLFFAKRE